MTSTPLRALSAGLVAGLVLVGAVAGPALASPSGVRAAPGDDLAAVPLADQPVATGESCAVEAQPLLPGEDPASLPAAPEVCFGSLEEALEFVSGDAVAPSRLGRATRAAAAGRAGELNATTTAGPRAAAERATTAAAGSIVLGVLWRDPSYKGASKVLYGSGTNGCHTGSTYGFPNLANLLMNNVVSSASTYAGCWATLYDSYSYAGTKKNCTPHCATLGSFDDRASSVVYRPAGTLG